MIKGWPPDAAPLRTLRDLGNLGPDKMPEWLNRPAHEVTPGYITYECATRRGLIPRQIVDLAALVIEGYYVCIFPRGRWNLIMIKQRTKEPGT